MKKSTHQQLAGFALETSMPWSMPGKAEKKNSISSS